MRYALLAVLMLGAMPLMAEAGHRDHRSRDRGSRWSVSIGFGQSSHGYRGGDYFDTRITYSEGYNRGYSSRSHVSYRAPRYVYRETYCPPPVVYRPAPVYVAPAPVYVAPPPVVYYPTTTYGTQACYPTGGYSYYRASYHYGR